MAQDYQGEEEPHFAHTDLNTEDYDHPGGGSQMVEIEQESQVRHECQSCGQQVLPYSSALCKREGNRSDEPERQAYIRIRSDPTWIDNV